MDFTNVVDIVQVFANEYCTPASLVLIIKPGEYDYKDIFSFINSETITIDDVPGENIDIVSDILPFEENSFDLIINFSSNVKEIKKFLKKHGKCLTGEFVVDALEYYKLNFTFFSVV